MSRKAKWGIGFLVFLLVLTIYGVAIEPYWLEVAEIEAELPNLPPEWEGERIGVLADFQIGMWWHNLPTIEEAVAEAIEGEVTAVLFVGDFLYKATQDDRDQIGIAVSLLTPLLEADIPIYAVLGNHDYSVNWRDDPIAEQQIDSLTTRLQDAGVHLLRNESAELYLPRDATVPPLHIVGIDSVWVGLAQPKTAVATVPPNAPRIIFMHNPNAYLQLDAHEAPLAIAGHTHGGQIRIPLIPERDLLGILHDGELAGNGWAEDDFGAEGNRLYINRGIGFSFLPIRINTRPELTVLTLKPQE